MALVCTFATQPAALAWFALHRTLFGYPRVGTHVGGGIHVTQPGAAPGLTDPPLGWTVRHRRFRRKVALGVYGWVVDAAFQALAANPTARARLTAGQRTLLDNNLASATNDATWDVVDGTTVDEVDP